MPYITQERRYEFDKFSEETQIETPGELNYIFTTAISDYLRIHKESYQTLNDVIGALTACQSEFYRRVVVPYEDEKIQENGDVY